MTNRYPKFADILRRRMEYQNLTVVGFAEALGTRKGSVVQWRNGYRLPNWKYLGGIADLLDAPILVEIANDYRGGVCSECSKRFLVNGHANYKRQKFCSNGCRSAYHQRLSRQRLTESKADRITTAKLRQKAAEEYRDRARAERDAVQSAVDAFCRSCEWDGVCKMADCQLRPFSPLPLATEDVA